MRLNVMIKLMLVYFKFILHYIFPKDLCTLLDAALYIYTLYDSLYYDIIIITCIITSVDELCAVLDDDAEVFVVKLWRMLIFSALKAAME